MPHTPTQEMSLQTLVKDGAIQSGTAVEVDEAGLQKSDSEFSNSDNSEHQSDEDRQSDSGDDDLDRYADNAEALAKSLAAEVEVL